MAALPAAVECLQVNLELRDVYFLTIGMWLGGILMYAGLAFGKLLAFAVGRLCVGEVFSKAGLILRKIPAVCRNVVALRFICLIRFFVGTLSDRDSILDSITTDCAILLAGVLLGVLFGMFFKHSLVVRASIAIENILIAGAVFASTVLLNYNKQQRPVARHGRKLRQKKRNEAARNASTDNIAPDDGNGDIDNDSEVAAQENSVANKPAIKPRRAATRKGDNPNASYRDRPYSIDKVPKPNNVAEYSANTDRGKSRAQADDIRREMDILKMRLQPCADETMETTDLHCTQEVEPENGASSRSRGESTLSEYRFRLGYTGKENKRLTLEIVNGTVHDGPLAILTQ
ncbi:uncharacterized protein N0V89_005479 [Didymosphaeria variabile]|uniref:Uncharacterized protein n=1 Tax=Didymosphaeria variabile TaxID=1932322 RepID=A0A9W8XLJ2_9PLEO|nr:uncharacterized protein N0V89_005479 [Didymosphaeria variabile]KAJ4353749.1 hypothetical protein N0V89_005479 [Didymosphaeria variabile]